MREHLKMHLKKVHAHVSALPKGAVIIAAGTVLLAAFLLTPYILNGWENTMMRLEPSAERAYAYATRHFDARNSSVMYDIDRAELLYKEAIALDAAHALAYHQLARIAFLRGGFYKALGLIDASIVLQGEPINPSSYYVRGLILGFMGRYDEAAQNFEVFLAKYPSNWAAVNDYAWALLKAERAREVVDVVGKALENSPTNPWLLNTYAIALYETGAYTDALLAAQKAKATVTDVSEEDWLIAYPGNDPEIARDGVAAFKNAIAENMHRIEVVLGASAVQSD